MRPLPTSPESLPESHSKASRHALELGSSAIASNHRRSGAGSRSAYPWLLIAATSLAGAFCYLYLTKPVIAAPQATAPPSSPGVEEAEAATSPPAPAKPEAVAPATLSNPDASPFEETVLRMQHVVLATGPQNEDLGRLTIEVPVAYESGTIRWSRDDVALARSLLSRIDQHRAKTLALREEAVSLITEWDDLMIRSIPESALRADSPTLPENQGAGTADQAGFKSTETIEINER